MNTSHEYITWIPFSTSFDPICDIVIEKRLFLLVLSYACSIQCMPNIFHTSNHQYIEHQTSSSPICQKRNINKNLTLQVESILLLYKIVKGIVTIFAYIHDTLLLFKNRKKKDKHSIAFMLNSPYEKSLSLKECVGLNKIRVTLTFSKIHSFHIQPVIGTHRLMIL